MTKMNTGKSKSEISTIALVTLLAVSFLVIAFPAVQAQSLIMNCASQAILDFPFNVDLNGPTTQLTGLKFAYKAPGAANFVLTTDFPIDNEPGLPGERYVTDTSGDCDIVVTFDQIGDWQVKWVQPSSGMESDVVTVTVLEEVTKQSFPYLGAIPNPVGQNQPVLLHVGITEPEARVDYGWKNLTVTVKDPQGGTSTLGPYNTDATGGTGGTFIPTMVGQYELQTVFPKQRGSNGITMLAGTSDVLYLDVQEEAIPYYPEHLLPSEYWTRPIDSQLREWYRIAGNWLDTPPGNTKYAPYNDDAPESAHILWTTPLAIGGVGGGATGEHGMTIGDAYEGKFPNRIILAGRLYYTEGGSRGLEKVETICVDLHTGEEVWRKVFLDNRSISFGQMFFWDSFNMHGIFPYLWVVNRNTYTAFDAYSGDWRFTVENVPSGTRLFDDNGGIQILSVNTRSGEMSLWAMDGWIHALVGSSAGSWGNSIEGQVHDASSASWADSWLWTVDIPTDLQGSVLTVLKDRLIGGQVSNTAVTLWGISLDEDDRGDVMFDNTWQAPAYWEEGQVTVSGFGGGWQIWSEEDKVGILWVKETREYYGFSLETGKNIWGPTEPQYYLDAVDDTPTESRAAAYGYFYSLSLGGIVYCYDIQTGEVEWTYEAEDPYQEFLFANNWWGKPCFITDGKIYLGSLEHSPIDPKPRGAPFYCLDAYNGDVIWRADGLFRSTRWGGRAIIGDSIIAAMDTYDQRVYAIGKGPSTLSVEKPQAVTELGSVVTLQGTVMDVSPGTEDDALQLRFPHGVPAVSDASMSDWMLYVYKNFERPADATGVTVKVEVLTPSGGYENLGTTTSDSYGNWAFGLCPEEAGTYMVIATFEGSAAYYGSTQTTYLTVAEPVGPDMSGLESSVNSVEDSVSGLTTYVMAILVLVIIALLIAVYLLLKK
jgi:hypothetical protein